jgi:5-methylcytosine-specific restriction endonuclease McrA
MRTLVLNSDMKPFDVWGWQKTMTKLLCDNAVYVLEEYLHIIRDGSGNEYRVPSVVVLKDYVAFQNKPAPYSRANIYARDSYRCQYCMVLLDNSSQRTVDHVIPRSLYNQRKYPFKLNSFENVVCCCKKCNTKKADKTLAQAGMSLVRKPKPVTRSQVYYLKLASTPKIPKEWRQYIGSQENPQQ